MEMVVNLLPGCLGLGLGLGLGFLLEDAPLLLALNSARFRISRLSVPGPGVQTADDALVDITVSRRVRLVLV
jgi:hypothetical protein